MLNIKQKAEEKINTLIKLLPLFAFIVPFLILYFYQDIAHPPYPYYYGSYANTFEVMWKGRTFYIFFLWLAALEMILGWEKLQLIKVNKLRSIRTVVFILSLLLPTVYIVISNYYGLNVAIVDWAWQNKIAQCDWMPLSIEYLVLVVLFTLIIWLQYGTSGLKNISLSPVFLATIGIIYTIDNIYQYGSFTPFQFLVPATATLAANVLNLMGYQTQWIGQSRGTPVLMAWNSKGSATFGIAWPCSGIESLLIYTITMLLFLKNTATPWKHRIIYFAFGAAVTFFINVMRIVTIFTIAIDTGVNSLQTQRFHDYYGQLYSITWIALYLLIIIASRALWRKIRTPKNAAISGLESPKLTS
jgi:thaumarchaeosortase